MQQNSPKTILEWRKVIFWELCKKRKFYHTDKWYMYKPESFQESETHKILWDFKIKRDHPIQKTKLSFD